MPECTRSQPWLYAAAIFANSTNRKAFLPLEHWDSRPGRFRCNDSNGLIMHLMNYAQECIIDERAVLEEGRASHMEDEYLLPTIEITVMELRASMLNVRV